MKKSIVVLTLALAAVLPSCIPSLHPLYSEDKLVFRKEILGEWQNGKETWVFSQGDGKYYELEFSDEDEQAEFKVHLVRLGDHYFFDFYNTKNRCSDDDGLAIAPLLATHSFAKVAFGQNDMKLYFFDIEWLEKLFEQRKIRIKHEVMEEDIIVLTAPTAELQEFVRKYAEEEQAFLSPEHLTK
ncbi:MAG: hypothetical protein H6557_02070 [Lewinellaceae bacterium]|nr:hypothetical protein [Phaeodactylibacter sp.]MCB9035383.1 hypothetical protein [Lewinellaceae bacterium]